MSLERTNGLEKLTEGMAIVSINNAKTFFERDLQVEDDECYGIDRSISNDSSLSFDIHSHDKSPTYADSNEAQFVTDTPRKKSSGSDFKKQLESATKLEDASIRHSFDCQKNKSFGTPVKSSSVSTQPEAISFEESCNEEKPCSSQGSAIVSLASTKDEEACPSLSNVDSQKTSTRAVNGRFLPRHLANGEKRRLRKKRRFRFGLSVRRPPIKPVQQSDNAEENSSFHRPNFINTVIMGGFEMDTWYWSPYPNECVSSGCVFICEKCLELKRSKETLQSHTVRCNAVFPPGDEIFRQDNLSVFEVDGEKAKIYCQHLCMLGKLFIDHKALFYDVEPFLFYVAALCDASGFHFVGYFSKQKHSEEKHNLSCIVTLPCYQERGYGRFLIDFSFLLTRRENVLGSAEKPLSELGLIAYRSYWRTAILEFLYVKLRKDGDFRDLSVDEIARATGIEHEDVLQTLNHLEMLSLEEDSVLLDINLTAVRSHWEKAKNDPRRIWIDERNLQWQPRDYGRLCESSSPQ